MGVVSACLGGSGLGIIRNMDRLRVNFLWLGKCPCCDYDLRGQRSELRCPECGLEYSADDLTIRTPLVVSISDTLASLTLAAMTGWYASALTGMLLSLTLMGLVLLLGWMFFRRHGHGIILIGRDGISCIRSSKRQLLVPWSKVSELKCVGVPVLGWFFEIHARDATRVRRFRCGRRPEDIRRALNGSKKLFDDWKATDHDPC